MNEMKAAQLIAWIQVTQLLLSAGVATAQQIAAFIRAIHGPAMSEDELGKICDWVISDAARRKAMADQDSATHQ